MLATQPTHRRLSRLAPACLGLVLGGCVSGQNQAPPVAIVTDLAAVAACAFVAPVGAPPFTPGYRLDLGYKDFQDALRRRTAALGGTHLYLTNPSAGWGGASAIGSAYRCLYVLR
ncbi:hypothetical protein ASF28_21240 [Methylobacterium sp. Leaf99]|nr:hypothetical protein ASF28_21240 [Methylobacterium sp. Leaf99]